MRVVLQWIQKQIIQYKIYFIFLGIGLFFGLLFGHCWFSPKFDNTIHTQTNSGNPITILPLGNYTNGVTNYVTLTNIITRISNADIMDTAPFIGTQTRDKMHVSLGYRYTLPDFKLQPWFFEKQIIAGIGADYSFIQNKFYPSAALGYEWQYCGVLVHTSQIQSSVLVFGRF